MAIRDSRRQRSRLLLFISSIVLGIAAMVAINTFIENVKGNINDEAKELLGADLVIRDNKKLDPKYDKIIDSFKLEKANEIRFSSMLRILKNDGTRLVNVIGNDGRFPFYGAIETIPADAHKTFINGNNCLLDQTLFIQFDLKVGDSIQIGDQNYAAIGQITQAPGQTGFSSAVAPAVYIPLTTVEKTGLIRYGSRLSEYCYVKTEDALALAALTKSIDDASKNSSIRISSFADRSAQTGEAFGDAGRFLNLVAFIALLLGCIGIASTVNIYLQSKIKDIAVLACIGISAKKAFNIYLIQILIFGFFGALAGVTLGTALAYYLPVLVSDFLPVDVDFAISPIAIAFGLVVGLVVSVLFTIETLFKLANTSPLVAIRSFAENIKAKPWQTWLSRITIFVFIIAFSWYLLEGLSNALIFTISCGMALSLLAAVSEGLKRLGKLLIRPGWPFVLRQSISNLFRPNNQSTILISTIGLGTALISLLLFTQDMLLSKVDFQSNNEDPNMILFDIQSPQLNDIKDFVEEQEMPVKAVVPIVTMRLESLRGESKNFYFSETADAKEETEDEERQLTENVFNREYRISFRDELNDNEAIIEGEWIGAYTGNGPVPISIEKRSFARMEATIGDELVYNVQGAPINCYIASVRDVDFRRIETNFTILFPTGVLEKAPQTHVIITRASSKEQSANFQRALISKYPTISIVDLNFIIKTVTEIIDKLKFIISFMSLFSIITGFIVLIGSIFNSRYQRIKETVLLKTLGASVKTISRINLIEYAFIGLFASLAGVILAITAAYALSIFTFNSVFTPSFFSLFVPIITITGLVVAIGWLSTNSITRQTPLEVLRKES